LDIICVLLFTVGRGQREAENHTGAVRETTEKNQESGNESNESNASSGKLVKHAGTDPGRESERGIEGSAIKRKKGIERGKERNLKIVATEEVEAEIGHPTGERAGSQDILKIIHLRWAAFCLRCLRSSR